MSRETRFAFKTWSCFKFWLVRKYSNLKILSKFNETLIVSEYINHEKGNLQVLNNRQRPGIGTVDFEHPHFIQMCGSTYFQYIKILPFCRNLLEKCLGWHTQNTNENFN